MRIEIDEDTPALGELIVEGELAFKPGITAELKAAAVRVRGGALRAGAAGAPFTGRATITLTDTNTASTDPMGTRGIVVTAGGRLQLYGNPPPVTWARLDAHADAGSTALTLDRSVNWAAGDQVVLAPTEWYGNTDASQSAQDAQQQTERRTLAANAANIAIKLSQGLAQFRWGRMQYVTDTGMSLTQGPFTKPDPNAVTTLDERAEVGNLTRNIVIQGADDAAWRNNGFGAHVMVMDLSSSLQMDGVELRRVGQAGKVGRYPIHWHLLSYADGGSVALGDATGHFVRNSAVWDSRHRCIVIHGTNGVEVRNNICYDIKGHAIFLEDADERRNVIEGNLVLRVRSPIDSLAVTEHEKRNFCGASAGYWLTNPDNTVRNNVVADAQGNGFWLSYPSKPVKQGKNVPIRPQNLRHGVFEFNASHSNGNNGLMLDCAMTDDAGNLALLSYQPTVDGSLYNYSNGVSFELKGVTSTKNAGGYVNRASLPQYLQWAVADNTGRTFSGSVQSPTQPSTLKQSLIVGKSLNDRQPYPPNADPQLGVASYHSALDIAQNTFVNLSNRGYVLTTSGRDLPSGAFGTDDYYLRPVEKGLWRDPGNKLVNADPGYRALPPHLQPGYTAASNNNWTLAGAIWDPHGYWGSAGRWWAIDSPFLRDASCTTVMTRQPAGRANGLSCAGPYYGVGNFELNRGLAGATQAYLFFETLDVERFDAADNSLGHWRVEQGYTSNFLGQMRHFAALANGSYVVRFPEFPNASAAKTAPRWVHMQLDNIRDAGDSVLLGVHFDGATTPRRVMVSTNPDYPNFSTDSRLLSAASNRAAVAAGSGTLYWRDTANNLVWIKLTPLGLDVWKGVKAGSDEDLFHSYYLRIEP